MAIDARLSTDVLWTDRIRTDRSSGSDVVTTVRPGVRVAADGDRVKGYVDYSLNRLVHARNQSLDRTQNSLLANGQIEAIEDFAFLDVTGTISQQSISAFGQQTDDETSFNPNRTEVSTFRVSPYFQGRVGQWAAYTARYTRTTQSTDTALRPGQSTNDISAQLRGTSGMTALQWSTDWTRQNTDSGVGIAYRSERLRAVLGYPVTPQLVLSVIPGRESNNYVSGSMESANTLGASGEWRPSDRTRLNALFEKRFFGRAHQVAFEHRTPRTAWRFTDSRDVSATPRLSGALSMGPLYELLFLQFSSIEPDPERRALLVESYIQANGLDRNTQVRLDFLSSSASLQQRRDLSFTLIGRRESLTVLASQSRTSRLSQFTTELDDLATSTVIRRRGLSVVYSHRMTPQTSWSATASHIRTEGDLSSQESTLNTLNLTLSTRLGRHTSASLGLRHSIYDNETNPYSESSVRAAVNFTF